MVWKESKGSEWTLSTRSRHEDQLAIKQARPWVSFWAGIKADDDLAVEELIDPVASSSLGAEELVTMRVANTGLNDMSDFRPLPAGKRDS